MHLIIYFDGTGGPGYSLEGMDYISSATGIYTAHVKGCASPEVCNSSFSPNLKKFAQRFARTLFSNSTGFLRLKTTNRESLKSIGLNSELPSKHPDSKLPSLVDASPAENIESITLCGYS